MLRQRNIMCLLICASMSLIFYSRIDAQDIHFSQYSASPLNLNPATTGFFNGNTRLIFNHRNQWGSVTIPFLTFSGSVDLQLFRNSKRGNALSIGVLFNADKAGDSKYSCIQGNLSLAYLQSLNKYNTHFISGGIMGGYVQNSIDYSKLSFDNQFNGYTFDPSLYNGENFNMNSFYYIDLSVGLFWFLQFGENQSIDAGFALFHLLPPKVSMLEDSKIILDKRYSFFCDLKLGISENIEFIPKVLLMFQGTYMELVYGLKTRIVKKLNYFENAGISLGVYSRHADAVILEIGLEYLNFNIGFSYDINYSDLDRASQAKGGYEISASYIFSKKKYRKIKEVPCPVF